MQSAEHKGKGNAFVPKTIALDQVTDARPLELLLFEAEHCWASAEELWAQQDTSATPRSVLRRRSLARGRRAVSHAEQLQTLATAMQASLDVGARAQCTAYVGLVHSASLFIKGAWHEALVHCVATRELLTCIAECASNSRDEALASSFLDALDAQIRFAAYSLCDADQGSDAVVGRVATPAACEQALPGTTELQKALRKAHGDRTDDAKPLELHWRSYTVPIHSMELYDAVTRVNEEEAQLARYLDASEATRPPPVASRAPRARLSHAQRNEKRRGGAPGATIRAANAQRANHNEMDPFDRVLSALTDAEETARTLVDENAQALHKSHSARYEAAGDEWRRAHEFLMYRLLSVRIARNMRLVEEVQAKAAKRDQKAALLFRERCPAHKHTAAGKPPGASQKRPGPGARAKRSRTTPKAFRRKPGRSGTRARTQAQRVAKEQRAYKAATVKTERRGTRIVPGIAKLLESVDNALGTIGGLVMVEGEPDVSSLMEAKRFYYCAVQLGHLARAFLQHSLHAEALVLLQRGELYLRQATQALELAEGAEDQDTAFLPRLLESDAVAKQQAALASVRTDVYASLSRPHDTPSASLKDTKLGQTLYYHAQRHVSFDPVDLAHALEQAPAPEELIDHEEPVDDEGESGVPSPYAPAGAYDPANAQPDEDATQRSWLGGWFRRGK